MEDATNCNGVAGKICSKCGDEFFYPVPQPISDSERWKYKTGMMACIRSGQLVMTRKMSDEYVLDLIGA